MTDVKPLTLRLSFKDMTTEVFVSKERVRGEEKNCYCMLGQVFHALGVSDETLQHQSATKMATEVPIEWAVKLFQGADSFHPIVCPRLQNVIVLNDQEYTENDLGEEVALNENENYRRAAAELMRVISEISVKWIEDEVKE